MQTSASSLAALADQFLVAYACTSAVDASVAALFNVGHAAELYLKAAMCIADPQRDVATYKHDLAGLLRDIQALEPKLLAEYSLRQRAIDLYLTNVDLPASAKSDPDYDHFNHNRELYWVSTYLMDTKYLFASHGRMLSGKSFSIMILGLNEYWQPFFKQLREYLRSRGVQLSQTLVKSASSSNMSAPAKTYLRGVA